jgi:hypothetical protein
LEIADVTETSPDAGADVAVTPPRPSGLSTAAVARDGHSLDVLASILGPEVDLSEMPDVDLWSARIPGTHDQDPFSGVADLLAGYDSYVDQPIDVPRCNSPATSRSDLRQVGSAVALAVVALPLAMPAVAAAPRRTRMGIRLS